MPNSRPHRDPSRIFVRLLVVLGLTGGALLGSALPASAGQCFYVYQDGYGTTVCTP